MKPVELKPEELICRCAESEIPAPATKSPDDEPPTLPGQDRGLGALEFGLSLKKKWFNIAVSGAPDSGKTTIVHGVVSERASTEPPGMDICIHQNFANPHKPGVMFLPPGSGHIINGLLDELLKLLDNQIPHLLEQPSVKAQIQELRETYELRERELSRSVEEFAEQRGIVMQSTNQGMNLIPLADGKPMTEEAYLSMGVEEREGIAARRKEVLEQLSEVNPQILAVVKEMREAVEAFVKNAVRELLSGYHADMRSLIPEETPELAAFLEALEQEIINKRYLFLGESGSAQPFGGAQLQVMRQQFAKQCRLNIVVDRAGESSAPVVVENNPTYSNLIGGVDFIEEQGVLKADFTQIRGGSLLQASGGYLIVQAEDLMQNPLAYYSLKRALRSGEVKLRDQMAEMGLRSAAHLEPQAVPVNAKVIVVGDERLVHLMQTADEEFARLFKIHADFSGTLERTPEVLEQFVSYINHHAQEDGLLPLDQGGMARLVEEASREVSHQNRLSAQVQRLLDNLIEADLLARKEGQFTLNRDMVSQALSKKRYRHSKIEEIVKREISEGTILLDFEGSRVGQVNGLAVYQVGRVAFGVPSRITAQAYAGRSGLINVEREADLSGRLHTKGVLILNGYLGKLFARKQPLALSVSITFEQNYGGIEGDSATAAEFFVIVSAIAQVPLKQSIGVTGSMNQHGEIQPIGGVNEKITGFYQFAKEHGFPDGSGVMIPAVNKVNLMLDEEIVAAVREGKFHIYPVGRIEEGLELMTGLSAGELQSNGEYTPQSVFALCMEKLQEFSREAKAAQVDKKPDGGPGQMDEAASNP
ncbi:MAG: AAA family ATPase [SAR324 cluster bacterium]|nr:AAA family ATPase [SAR324 cluster bacterium]